MEEKKTKIKSFTDLKAWQESHKLALLVYKSTEDFPNKEMFGLTNQLRRASVSVASNIAEGFARQHVKEKVQFYSTAKGSLVEVQSQILIARDIGYMTKHVFKEIADQTIIVSKLITGLKRIKDST